MAFSDSRGMIRQSPPTPILASALLVLVVALSPLALGGILPAARTMLEIIALLALATAAWACRDLGPLAVARAPLLALAGLGFWGLLQALPWPRWWVGLIAPGLRAAWDGAREITDAADTATHLSLAPATSIQTGISFLATAAAFGAAVLAGGARRSRRLAAIVWLGVLIFAIVYGLDSWAKGQGLIWGLTLPGDASRLRGTMINPNHFAFYLNLAITACFAAFWWCLRRARETEQLDRRLLLAAGPSLLFVLLFAALAFTGSRGGFLAAVVAIGVQTALLAWHYRRWSTGWLAVAALGLGLGAIAFFGARQGLGRWLESSAFDVVWGSRITVYWQSLKLWWRFPLTGSGLGTFRQAFPLVQPFEPAGTWTHAHNDVLELLVTGGVIALPLLGWGLARLVLHLRRVFHLGRRSEDRAAGLAALGALAATLVHSLVDFSLTVPANALTLAILCGMAAGAAVGKTAPEGGPAVSAEPPARARPDDL